MGSGGRLIRECKEVDHLREEIRDEGVQKQLWAFSEKQIEVLEKDGAVKRAFAKKENDRAKKAEPSKLGDNETGITTEKAKSMKASKAPGSRRSRKAG